MSQLYSNARAALAYCLDRLDNDDLDRLNEALPRFSAQLVDAAEAIPAAYQWRSLVAMASPASPTYRGPRSRP